MGFHFWLHEFKPSGKFWGTKVLVTLACVQGALKGLIPGIASWDSTYKNLGYSSVLCIECFWIALLHVLAWSAQEDWYKPEHLKQTWDADKDEERPSLYDGEGK